MINKQQDEHAAISEEADVCLLVEGCYPYVRGGVSSWVDWLMRSHPNLNFIVTSIWPKPSSSKPCYALPPNALGHQHLFLYEQPNMKQISRGKRLDVEAVSETLLALVRNGSASEFARLIELLNDVSVHELLRSRHSWELTRRMYEEHMPQTAFLEYFWTWRSLFGGLFATIAHPLPKARIYHAISTGYAGLLAAKARLTTQRPTVLTEHGIYTNERRIEILMADWIADTVDKGFFLDDSRNDLRDMWIDAFESYAKICYSCCDEIITLYAANHELQLETGAPAEHLRVIPNGVNVAQFSGLLRAGPNERPTMAFIGRIAPIKDVKCFIAAVAVVRESVPNVQALILGPDGEDPEYAHECRELVRVSDLEQTATFTGSVDIADYLPKIHVVVLTSLSEAQPLILLEAGAAGIPCVTTDVGACREILHGASDEIPNLGEGGIVTGLVASNEIGAAVTALLADHERRRHCGDVLKERVTRVYNADYVAEAYSQLYRRLRGDADSEWKNVA